MAKAIETKIDKLIADDLNANKGTEYGGHLMEKSFRELGAGRSILLDRNNRIIAGNKSAETAAAIGLDNVIIVETDGTKLVAVKRMDIDIDSKQGRELALADNATSKANLAWDAEAIAQITEQWEVTPEDWGIKADIGENDPDAEWKGMPEFKAEDQMGAKQIIVHFKSMKDYELFGAIINQKLSDKTKSIWYPEEGRGSQTDHVYEAEEVQGNE
ncbi:hypothetical protein JZU61_04420 [bacterium]|jgi:hypothetical protein|nr:hypothetical protein [bacterium]